MNDAPGTLSKSKKAMRAEAAVSLCPTEGVFHRALCTATYCTTLFVGGCVVNIIGQVGPTLATNMHVSIAAIGQIFAAEGVGNMLGSSLIAALLNRFTGHALIAFNCTLLFFIVGVVPSCSSIYQVVCLYLCAGVCLGINNGTANTLITWAHAGRNVGPWVNLINASFGLGASSAPLLFVAVERHVGNGLVAFSVIGALAAVPAIGAFCLRSPHAPAKKVQPQPPSPHKPAHLASGHDAAGAPKGMGSTHGGSTIAGVDLGSRVAYIRATVIVPLMLVITLVIGSQIAFAGWAYSYAMNRVGLRSADAAYLNSLFWSSLTVGRLCTIPLAAVLSPGALLIPTMLFEVGSLLTIHLNAGSASALWGGTVGAGIGVCALYSNSISMLASYDLLTPDTVSSIGLAAAVGHMTMPNFVGHAIQSWGYGYDPLIWIVLASQTAGCVLVSAVVVHLRLHFEPVASSVHGRKLATARRLAAIREAASGDVSRVV